MGMKRLYRLILSHILESVTKAVAAALVALLLRAVCSKQFAYLVEGLTGLGEYGIGALTVFALVFLAVAFPRGFNSTIISVKLFPKHLGLVVQVLIGVGAYLLLSYFVVGYVIDGYSVCLLLSFSAFGLLLGYLATWQIQKPLERSRTVDSKNLEGQDEDIWLVDDQPIQTEQENLFAAHSGVARRMLKRLLAEPDRGTSVLPNIALIGPYGSGKTSICNLVEHYYCEDKRTERLPKLLFCRFEAWQFLSAEAAVRNLIEVAADKILDMGDFAALWKIPQKYIEAIKASGSRWSKFVAAFLGGPDNPEEIMSAIGDVLVRLNVRLMIFVDDFDRIEEDSFATQQAIAKALNQLQNLPNTQYIISVGQTTKAGGSERAGKRSWDLLKLTRFQELVPCVDPAEVVKLSKQLRERALKNHDYYLPWSEIKENEVDPLTWHPGWSTLFSRVGYLGRLIGLVSTPRTLKSTLRESGLAWEGGLKGEIDWHDLVLANALKAAEPAVFEWIARDRDIFIEEPPKNVTEPEALANKNYAKELEQRLIERVESKDSARYEIVKEAVCELFPAFKTKLEGGESWSSPPHPWSQKIALRPNQGADYIERFFAGCVPEGDIPDQPTLQYIRRTTGAGFNGHEFACLYLDSVDKLTGSFNKLVQFAGLIPRHLAHLICETVLEWIAEPKHAESWPEPDRFVLSVLPDVFAILDNAGRRERVRFPLDSAVTAETEEWFGNMVDRFTFRSLLLAVLLVQGATEKGYKALCDKLLGHIKVGFVQNKQKLMPSLIVSRFALAWILDSLSTCEAYGELKAGFTQSTIAEADHETGAELKERIVFSLVGTSTPRRSGEIRPEEYQFSILKEENQKRYDMDLITEALNRWYPASWSDDIAKRAFTQLHNVYCASNK